MAIETSNQVMATELASIISAINAEVTRRGGAGTVQPVPSTQSAILAYHISKSVANNTSINAAHTYAAASVHKGGVTKTLTANILNFISGAGIAASAINSIAADISVLAAQTACTNTVTGCCNAQCAANGCSCNTNCSCNTQCTNGTSCGNCCNGQCCNAQACNGVSCSVYGGSTYVPGCTNGISCYNCCNGQCVNGSYGAYCCNGQCNNCSCNANCSCNTVCTCEFV